MPTCYVKYPGMLIPYNGNVKITSKLHIDQSMASGALRELPQCSIVPPNLLYSFMYINVNAT